MLFHNLILWTIHEYLHIFIVIFDYLLLVINFHNSVNHFQLPSSYTPQILWAHRSMNVGHIYYHHHSVERFLLQLHASKSMII